ncbi:hypothetical protein P4H32_32380 [Bacillus cereus]|nr:hypothetical protein [Bacillus cereus]
MESIFLGITIILYIITFFIMVLTVFKKHQASEGYDVAWDSFRFKIRKWFISTVILGGIFNILYIFTT